MASPYYTVKELSNIKNYKAGTTIDKSLIYQYLVSPFCARLVQYLPSWLAPNVLTLFGLLCNIINLVLAVTFLADNPDPPRWVYLACAWFLFVYMISDNCDGKQAVRTGSSTPLGEGLDHGCDSLIVGMTALTSAYVLGVPLSYPLMWGGYGYVAFYLAHWQEYFTHFLELGYFNGPTEAESFAILTYLFTFFVGRAWWHTPMNFPFGFTVPPYQALSIVLVFVTVFTIVSTLWKGTILATNKNVSISRAYSQLLPITTSWVAGVVWVTYTPEVYYSHPAIFFTATNFLFSYLTINCIIQRMCDLPYQYFYWPSFGIFIAAVNSFLAATGTEVIPSIPLLYALWFVWGAVFLHFAVSVVQALCGQVVI